MVEDAESVTMLHQGLRKARKTHKCMECHRIVGKGEEYESAFFIHEGKTHHKTCLHCLAAREWLRKECGGWCYGGVEEDLREHWHEDARCRKLSLGRLIVGMANGWRRKGGDLMAVPEAKEEAKA